VSYHRVHQTVIGTLDDETAEMRLRRSEARYRGIVEDQTDFIVRYRPDGVRTFVNRPYAEFFGGTPDDYVGKSFFPLVKPEHRAAVEEKVRKLASGEAAVLVDEHLSTRHDGVFCWTLWVDRAILDEDGKVVEIQAVGRDITDRKEAERRRLLLEQRLGQAQKMEALGTLAGGLAHDFNNSLTGILALADLIRSSAHDPRQVAEYAESIRQTAERASELTRSLLQLNRRAPSRLARCSIQDIVHTAARLLRASVPRRIELDVDAPELAPVLADAGQLTQAIINLGLNARDAILDRGHIRIAAGSERENGDALVVIRVTDDGVGISESVRARLFEPFFTTKAEGRGTGLGLAMVYACARAHGGRVEVASEVGRGTTLELRLPLAPSPRESSALLSGLEGHERILLVDDEPLVVLRCRQVLESHGYEVLTAGSGEEAVAAFGSRIEEIDAVVVDLVMSPGNGRELEEAFHARRPSLPIVLMTGGLVGERSGDFAGMLEKPFSSDELLASLRAVLDGGGRIARS
jgi:PAS domain S-box-containing protein